MKNNQYTAQHNKKQHGSQRDSLLEKVILVTIKRQIGRAHV